MTSERRLEQDLPRLLEQLTLGPIPDYRNDIVQQTAGMRQRPAWTFPERLLPMTVITSRVSAAPQIPWRIVGVVALLLLTLLVAAILIAGSQPRLPAPFGLAANGQVAYASEGDIYTADPVSGIATAVITGSDTDVGPVWSRDGTHLAFERKVAAFEDPGRLYAARSDGTELIALTPEPRFLLDSVAFSPNGREVIFASGSGDQRELWIVNADGGGLRQLNVGMPVQEAAYRAPDGAEIIFASATNDHLFGDSVGQGVYAFDVRTGKVRTLVAPSADVGLGWIRVSPDGSRIAYVAWRPDPARNTFVVHVVAAEGAPDIALPMPLRAAFQDAPAWANSGQQLVIIRGYAARDLDISIAIVPADGSGVGVETERGLTSCCSTEYEWAPDDSTILVRPNGFNNQEPLQQLLLDPVTGATKSAPWDATSRPAWQRRAP